MKLLSDYRSYNTGCLECRKRLIEEFNVYYPLNVEICDNIRIYLEFVLVEETNYIGYKVIIENFITKKSSILLFQNTLWEITEQKNTIWNIVRKTHFELQNLIYRIAKAIKIIRILENESHNS